MEINTFFQKSSYWLMFSVLFVFVACGDDDTDPGPGETSFQVSIQGSATVEESAQGAGFKILLDQSNDTGSDITISYSLGGTATAGQDYQSPTGTATIAAGQTEVMVNISLLDDNDDEGDETITVTLSASGLPSNVSLASTSSLTITIEDDDADTGVCDNDNSTDQDDRGCDTTPKVSNTYSESTGMGDTRTITTNGIPTHDYRNQIPMIVSELNDDEKIFTVDKTPAVAAATTSILQPNGRPKWKFGVAKNGVAIDPAPAEPFIFTDDQGEFNWDWVFEPNNNMNAVGLDCAIAHVQPDGTYHYHGDMAVYADELLAGLGTGSTVPSEPVQIGWAADGFPILYKYGPDGSGAIKKLASSYQLKSGERPGDGDSEPCGTYNGKYTNDYEYNAAAGDLDECNGVSRSITIGGETFVYFYVITDEFPIISRCIVGTPNDSFGLR